MSISLASIDSFTNSCNPGASLPGNQCALSAAVPQQRREPRWNQLVIWHTRHAGAVIRQCSSEAAADAVTVAQRARQAVHAQTAEQRGVGTSKARLENDLWRADKTFPDTTPCKTTIVYRHNKQYCSDSQNRSLSVLERLITRQTAH